MIAKDLPANYGMLDGTSMAAPYISGACALIWSQLKHEHPNDCNYMNVKNSILNTAEKLPVLNGKCRTEGRLNLYNAITNTIPVPMARITGGDANAIIQDAINKANDDDEIVLDKGTFYQNVDITSSHAKRLTIRSTDPNNPAVVANTLISRPTEGTVININLNDGSTLDGLTIYGSSTPLVYVQNNSVATISKCRISSDRGAIYSNHSTVDVVGCHLNGYGTNSGINSQYDNLTISNCLIYGFYDGINATSIYSANIRNSTIVNNAGKGIYLEHGPSYHAPVRNCIVWGNAVQIDDDDPNVSYCCVQGTPVFTGAGNINSAPCFVAPDANDFHLLFNSPCINAGDPNFIPAPNETDIDGEQRVLRRDNSGNPRVDMGADEYWAGDFNNDGIVNFKDFTKLANGWLKTWSGSNPNDLYDLNNDNAIDNEDLDIFTNFWLTTNSSYVPDGGGEQMQGEGGDSLELDSGGGEMLLDGEQATISLVCDVNDPNEGDEVTIYVYTDAPLWLFGIGVNVIGDANITAAMSSTDCNEYGWDPNWPTDPTIDEPNDYVDLGAVMFSDEGVGPGNVGYIKLLYHSGQVSLTIDWGCGLDNYGAYTQFSTETLFIGRDPNQP